MNDAMYNVASFMVWREAVSWRWSHIRHHSDTIVVGRDPEIAFPRPMKLRRALLECFGLISNVAEFRKIATNVVGRFTPEELDYLPVAERPKAVRTARVYVVAWSAVIAFAVAQRSVEPLMFVIGPSFYGKWLLVAYGITQHAGLAEDTLDHRLNTRTVRMNRLHRYLYWNMNYHVEHHMFPTVPYHALPALHEAVRHDTPPVYPGFTAVYREIWHVYRQQQTVPQHFVDRSTLLPHSNVSPRISSAGVNPTDESVASPPTSDWISVCESSELSPGALKCVEDHGRTYLVARLGNGELRATDGLCTHARVPLCDGALLGGILECPKHNGRFDLLTGKAIGRPVTIDLKVHDARERDGRIEMRART